MTQEEIASIRAQYKYDPSGLKTGAAPTMNDTDVRLARFRGEDVPLSSKTTTATATPENKDGFFARGVKAVKEAVPSLVDSFKKRGQDITDTSMKTSSQLYDTKVSSAPISRQNILDYFTKSDTENVDNPLQQMETKYLAPIRNALNTVGQVAGATGDILAEAAKVGYKTLTPEQTQVKLADGLHSILQTEGGKMGLQALSGGVDAYNKWAEANPDDAKQIGNILNIATLGVGKTVESAATPVIKQAVKQGAETVVKDGIPFVKDTIVKGFNKVVDMNTERVLNKSYKKAFENITPNVTDLTPTEYEAMLRKGKITPKTATSPAKYVLSDEEMAIAKKNAKLLQSKDPVENSINVMNDIVSKDQQVGTFLRKNNGAFNDGELRNFLTGKMKDITDITVDEGKLDAKKAQMIDNFIKGLPKNNMEELWTNRKAFDSYIEKAFSGSPTLTKELKKGLRNGVQDFISERTPEGVYKGYMKDMSQLFDLHDVVATKATKERDLNKIKKWIRDNPVKAKVIGYGASAYTLKQGYDMINK